MSISNVLHFSFAGQCQQGVSRTAPQGLSARQEYKAILASLSVFLAGSTGVALYALSAFGR